MMILEQTLLSVTKKLTGTPCVRVHVLIMLSMALMGHGGQVSNSILDPKTSCSFFCTFVHFSSIIWIRTDITLFDTIKVQKNKIE